MNSLLTRVRDLSKKADESDVDDLISYIDDRDRKVSIATIEEVLKHYKAQLKQILSKDLLDWMTENDQVTFETEDMKVAIKTYVSAKILDQEAGFKWLEDNKYGDLIKDNLEFPKGEFSSAAEQALEELGLSYTKKSGIHPQSLKKIVSDRLLAGDVLPDEENGIAVHYYDECQVKDK